MATFLPRLDAIVTRKDVVAVGHGHHLQFFTDYGLNSKIDIFPTDGNHVFGIKERPDGDLLVFGEKSLVAVDSSESSEYAKVSRPLNFEDSILQLSILHEDQIAILLTCNTIIHASLSKLHGELVMRTLRTVQSNHVAMLLQGMFVGNCWNDLVSIVGTVFGEILVSRPSQGSEVLHSYIGHTGMIFGLFLQSDLLYSISDDRSLRVWSFDKNDIKSCSTCELACAYGHTARPFAMCEDACGNIYTAGIDQIVRKWSYSKDGLLMVESVTLNIGGIRSLIWYKDRLWAGRDCGGLITISFPELTTCVELVPTCDDVRGFAIDNGFVYTVDGRGRLYKNNSHVYPELTLRFLVRTAVGEDYPAVVAYGDNDFVIFNRDNTHSIHIDEKIVSILCVNRRIAVYTLQKICVIYDFDGTRLTNISGVTALSKMSKRTTLVPSSLAVFTHDSKTWVLIGSNSGHLLFSTIPESPEDGTVNEFSSIASVNRLFAGDHLMTIHHVEGAIFKVLCKNGKISTWIIDHDEPQLIASVSCSDSVSMDWPCSIVTFEGATYVAGFHSTVFHLVDISSGLSVFSIACGGGNRPWWFAMNGSNVGSLYYIKNQELLRSISPLREFGQLDESLHRSQIVLVHSLFLIKESHVICTASTDNQLVYSVFNDATGAWDVLRRIFYAVGILCMDSFTAPNGNAVAVTGGGKGSISLWNISRNGLLARSTDAVREIAQITHPSCTRVVDIGFRKPSTDEFDISIAAALADGSIEVYTVPTQQCGKRCVFTALSRIIPDDLSLTTKVVYRRRNHENFLVTVGTSGRLIYRHGDKLDSSIKSLRAARCGLAAVDVIEFNGSMLAAAGNEAGETVICRIEDDVLSTLAVVKYHCATVTDVKLVVQRGTLMLYSISLDCRIAIHEIDIGSAKVTFLRALPLGVWDPSSFLLINSHAVVAGSGLETIDLN